MARPRRNVLYRRGAALSFAGSYGIPKKSKLAEAYLVMKPQTGERNLDLESELFLAIKQTARTPKHSKQLEK